MDLTKAYKPSKELVDKASHYAGITKKIIEEAMEPLKGLPYDVSTEVDNIKSKLPAVERAFPLVCQGNNEFAMLRLQIGQFDSPTRQIQQCMNQIQNSAPVLKKFAMDLELALIAIEMKKRKIKKEKDDLRKRKFEIELRKTEIGLHEISRLLIGNLKHVDYYCNLIWEIAESNNIDPENINEDDFAKDDKKHHLCTAFKQALQEFYAHGTVSAGDSDYLMRLGVRPDEVDSMCIAYQNFISKEKITPGQGDFSIFTDWLDDCYERFKDREGMMYIHNEPKMKVHGTRNKQE